MNNLTAWQLLLWIVGLELLSAPLIVASVSAVISGYFKAKEEHIGKMTKAAGTTITQIAESFKKEDKET